MPGTSQAGPFFPTRANLRAWKRQRKQEHWKLPRALGFPVPASYNGYNSDGSVAAITRWGELRRTLPYDTDGIVISWMTGNWPAGLAQPGIHRGQALHTSFPRNR